MRVILTLLVVACAMACASASMAPWERQALLQVDAMTYGPCGASKCGGSRSIPRGYECNCEKLDEHPLCGCAKVNNADNHPGYVVTSERPLPSNAGAKLGDIVLPPDDDSAMGFSAPKGAPSDLPPPAAHECIPNVAEVTPGTCVSGNNPNPNPVPAAPAPAVSAPAAPVPAPAAPVPAVPVASAAPATTVAPVVAVPAAAAAQTVVADKVATAAVAATAKVSLNAIASAEKQLQNATAQKEAVTQKLTALEQEVKAEAGKVKVKKQEELAVERRVVQEKQELVKQREALEAVEQRLKELNAVVRQTLKLAAQSQGDLNGTTAKDVAAMSLAINQESEREQQEQEQHQKHEQEQK